MKIAVTGKGGSGKTTIAAGLLLAFGQNNTKVIAVDCDPDANLGLTLGIPGAENVVPISQMKGLIAERSGVASLDKPTTFFTINPKVDDIPETYALQHGNIRLLVMGKVNKAGGGCMCPENTFVKSLISHLVLSRDDVVILDMVAGTEHLGRATAKSVDVFLIVVEPTEASIATALRIYALATELGIQKIYCVGNKIQSPADVDFLKENLNQKIKNGIIACISFSSHLQKNKGKFNFESSLSGEFQELYRSIISKE